MAISLKRVKIEEKLLPVGTHQRIGPPSVVTFPLPLRVSEILPLFCSSTPLFPTPRLVSPKFPHVPMGYVDDLWDTKSEVVGLIVRAIVSKISNLCGPDPPTLQTDRQTDKQTDDMRAQDRVLHKSASRGKKLNTYTKQHAWQREFIFP